MNETPITSISTITVKNKTYRINPDESWNKWKKMILENHSKMDEIDWYRENVFIDKPLGLQEMVECYIEAQKRFKLDDKQLKDFLKKSGKVGRGIRVDSMSSDAIEFYVLKNMNGAITYSDLDKIPFHKLLFYKRLLDSEIQQRNESVEKQNKEIESKNNIRGKRK